MEISPSQKNPVLPFNPGNNKNITPGESGQEINSAIKDKLEHINNKDKALMQQMDDLKKAQNPHIEKSKKCSKIRSSKITLAAFCTTALAPIFVPMIFPQAPIPMLALFMCASAVVGGAALFEHIHKKEATKIQVKLEDLSTEQKKIRDEKDILEKADKVTENENDKTSGINEEEQFVDVGGIKLAKRAMKSVINFFSS